MDMQADNYQSKSRLRGGHTLMKQTEGQGPLSFGPVRYGTVRYGRRGRGRGLSRDIFLIVLFLMVCAKAPEAHSAPWPQFTPQNIFRALIGEVGGESYRCQVATAEALRNRGNLAQVYGFKAKHVDREPRWVWERIEKAWRESEHSNITKGATIWGNDDDVKKFKKTTWFKNVEHTATVGGHHFFREKKGAKK